MYNVEKYSLDPDMIESWDRLEFALLDLMQKKNLCTSLASVIEIDSAMPKCESSQSTNTEKSCCWYAQLY